MTDAEHGMVMRLLQVPSLWAFALLAGRFGLDEAVALCDSKEALGADALAVLAEGDYTPDHLPDGESIRLAILGARLTTRDALELGIDGTEAVRAHVELTRYQPGELQRQWR